MAKIVGGRPAAARSLGSGIGKGIFLAMTGIALLVNLYLIFAYVPTERVMGIVQRLFYFHVPTALVGFISFAVAAAASIAYLLGRSRRWDRLAHASVEVGSVFFTLAILTGAIWARPVWNTWWVWDANGTLTFVLWTISLGYLIVRSYAPNADIGRRWAAIISVVGAAAVPFVYLAADWWGGLHPERVTGPGAEGSLASSMSLVLTYSLGAFLLLFAYLVHERMGLQESGEALEEIRQQTG